MFLEFPNGSLDLTCTRVMGVLNVTPDSFSDGGQFVSVDAAVARALEMVEAGADIIDIGGESTRPGAASVDTAEEIDRVVPVIEALRAVSTVPISLDTSKPAVMRAGVAAGASMLNDVRALTAPDALATAAELAVPVCLMHMQGSPETMQQNPVYQDVTEEIKCYFEARIELAIAAGIAKRHLLLDPGFGFGKTLAHNLELLTQLERFADLGLPILVGLSRKSMIAKILDRSGMADAGPESATRIAGSVTLALYAARHGAHIVRVHDVSETVAALAVESAALKFMRE